MSNNQFVNIGLTKTCLIQTHFFEGYITSNSLVEFEIFERPGLESQRNRGRLFFHRKIFKFLKYFIYNIETYTQKKVS